MGACILYILYIIHYILVYKNTCDIITFIFHTIIYENTINIGTYYVTYNILGRYIFIGF